MLLLALLSTAGTTALRAQEALPSMLSEEMAICRAYWNKTLPGKGTWVEEYCDVPRGKCCQGGTCATCVDDGDGLPYFWEVMHGLNGLDGSGVNGPQGDPDGDGVTNLEEFLADTHPLGFHRYYLAEGATSDSFATRLAVLAAPARGQPAPAGSTLNAGTSPAQISLNFKFLRSDGRTVTAFGWLDNSSSSNGGRGRRGTLDVGQVPGMEAAEFSTVVESSSPIVVERTMRWDASGYGSHAERALPGPATVWYLAEGATHSGFDLFYLLQNPHAEEARVRVRYLRPSGAPLEQTYTLGPRCRFNIWVDLKEFPRGSGSRLLEDTDVSAVLESVNGVGFLVERAMYLSRPGRLFNAGHASAGITAPSTDWFLAEGATGELFDLFVLLANPSATPAPVRVTYLLPSGQTYARQLTVAPQSRHTIWVDYESFAGVPGHPLADTAVSTTVESLDGVPLIVERAMWWPGAADTWHEAHNAAGSTRAAVAWGLADGETGDPTRAETYILIANTSPVSGEALVRLIFEDGSSAERTYAVAAQSRTTIAPAAEFPSSAGRRFGATVEALEGPAGRPMLVVERAMYSSALAPWDAGTATLGSVVDLRTCRNECTQDWDCGIAPGNCSGNLGGFCGDYVAYCAKGDPASGTCNTCTLLDWCDCYQNPPLEALRRGTLQVPGACVASGPLRGPGGSALAIGWQ